MKDYYYFKEEGSYIDDPDNAVAVALTAREGQMDTLLNPHFAFFTIPDAFGIADSQNRLIYDNQATKIVVDEGTCKGSNLLAGQVLFRQKFTL